MAAPRTVELKRRIVDTSTPIDQRLEAVTERIDQVDNESSGHFVQMRDFMFDGFETAQAELTKGLGALHTEMSQGFTAVRTEMTQGLTAVRAEMTPRLDRIEDKIDRLLKNRPARVRRPTRGR